MSDAQSQLARYVPKAAISDIQQAVLNIAERKYGKRQNGRERF